MQTGQRGEGSGNTKGSPPTRRGFLEGALAGALGGALGPRVLQAAGSIAEQAPSGPPLPPLRLGLVTYNLAKDWDLKTILKNCTEAKFEAVELRATHAHGVEVSLTQERRREVRALFQGSPVRLASLGSAFEFHSADPAEVRKNIEGAKEYAKLAADVGAQGIKVRPNGLQTRKGIPAEDTLRQIGRSLAEVGEAAGQLGVEVRVEVHGGDTSRLPNMRKILDQAAHPNVFVCWNSNDSDLLDGGLEENFALVKEKIRFVHMRDLFIENYPWRKLLRLLREARYAGYCCAEISESNDPLRVMRYYRALFLAYQDLL